MEDQGFTDDDYKDLEEALPHGELPPPSGPNISKGMKKIHPVLQLQTLLVVSISFVISTMLLFINKLLMEYYFPYPLTMTWIQFIIQYLSLVVVSGLGQVKYPHLSFVSIPDYSPLVAQKLAPTAMIFVGMIIANNLCLNYVEIGYYLTVHTLAIVFSLALPAALLNQQFSRELLGTCCIIVLGFLIATTGEINYSALGVTLGVLSAVFLSIYNLSLKNVTSTLNDDYWKLLAYNSFFAAVFMLPILIVSGELLPMITDGRTWQITTIFLNIFAGMLNFAVNLTIYAQLKFLSPITRTIYGPVKVFLQVILGAMIFRTPISVLNMVGTLMAVAGSGLYSYVRYVEVNKLLF